MKFYCGTKQLRVKDIYINGYCVHYYNKSNVVMFTTFKDESPLYMTPISEYVINYKDKTIKVWVI